MYWVFDLKTVNLRYSYNYSYSVDGDYAMNIIGLFLLIGVHSHGGVH